MKVETFDVKWHTFTDHVKNMLHKIRSTGLFTDVTFICDDQKELRAHMNIVGACSPVLKNIFNLLKGNNPTIYLKGIKHAEMESILEFMYLGEAKILSERVNDFLTVAKELPEQVKQVKMCSNLEREKGEMWKIWLKQVSIRKKTNFKGNTIKWVLL